MFNVGHPFYILAVLLALISNIVVICLFKKYDYSFKEIVGIVGGAKILESDYPKLKSHL